MWHGRRNIRKARFEALLGLLRGRIPRVFVLGCIERKPGDPLKLVGEEVPIFDG